MNPWKYIFQDFSANKGNTKGKLVCLLFRLSNLGSHNLILKYLMLPYIILYKITFEWLIGMEIPFNTTIGHGLKITHLQAIVINKDTIIGNYCQIRQSTTIGNAKSGGLSPRIGNNVNIGAHVCIIGDIVIGDNVVIGAGSIVVKDVPANTLVVGNPAKVVKILDLSC